MLHNSPLLYATPRHERVTRPTTYSKILFLLYEYHMQQRRYEYLPGVLLPPGQLPMSAFRGPLVGGDACHMRLWELRAPEEAFKHAKGIPIKKNRVYFQHHDDTDNIITYQLDIPRDLCEHVLDLEVVAINKPALAAYGLKCQDYLDDADGSDKPGRAVRLIPLTQTPELFA